MYELYKGVEISNTTFTGAHSAILPTLRRSFSAICREGRGVNAWYIGVASGTDYWTALKRRIDNYKLSVGINRVYLMYQSSSEKNTRSLERILEREFRDHNRIPTLNRKGGGGGRYSAGPFYFVYLAVNRK